MTWWCRLFHVKWWYRSWNRESLTRILCARCGDPGKPLFIYDEPVIMRNIAKKLQKE